MTIKELAVLAAGLPVEASEHITTEDVENAYKEATALASVISKENKKKGDSLHGLVNRGPDLDMGKLMRRLASEK